MNEANPAFKKYNNPVQTSTQSLKTIPSLMGLIFKNTAGPRGLQRPTTVLQLQETIEILSALMQFPCVQSAAAQGAEGEGEP